MSQYRFNTARLQQLAANTSQVAVSVHDYKKVSPVLAKVIISLSSDRCTQQELAHALTRAIGNDVSPVLGSFRQIPGARCLALAGFVVKQPEIVTASDDRFKHMRQLTASTMLDSQDSSLWDIRSAADGSTLLVRAGSEDLSELLQTASVRNVQAPRMSEMASASSVGEFIAFADPVSGELRHGFVIASEGENLSVVVEDSETPVETVEDTVVEAALLHGSEVTAASDVGIDSKNFDSRSKAAMTEFYKQLYGYAPGYVDEIQKQIDAHAVL